MQYLKSCSVVLTLCLLVACASVTGGSGGSVIVSETDPRAFRYLQLDNGLKVLLVSDPGADKAGASLDVHVGSRQDPKNYQGLAHFLEHMLFLGTEKYPNAGDYQAFISANGGQHNAFT
ncbi:MAG: insulinase family protein, partial [Spongiibacter sp.]